MQSSRRLRVAAYPWRLDSAKHFKCAAASSMYLCVYIASERVFVRARQNRFYARGEFMRQRLRFVIQLSVKAIRLTPPLRRGIFKRNSFGRVRQKRIKSFDGNVNDIIFERRRLSRTNTCVETDNRSSPLSTQNFQIKATTQNSAATIMERDK